MKFKTIEDYDQHITSLNKKLSKFKKYVDEHPEKIGVQGNFKAIKHVRDELIEERELFIKNHTDFLNETSL